MGPQREQRTAFLTRSEREQGQKSLFNFQAFNGVAFNYLGTTSIYLLAVHYGASNLQLGYLSSAHFLVGLILPFIPKLIAGKNLVRVQFYSWMIRGLVCLLYSLLYILEGAFAVSLILAVYTMYCTSRIVGVMVFNPVIKMVSSTRNRGEVVATVNTNFSRSMLAAQVLAFIVTSFQRFTGVFGVMVLQYVGIAANTIGSLLLRKIPCRQVAEQPKGGVVSQLKLAMKDPVLSRILFMQWINMGTLVLASLIIPFLRSSAGLSTNLIFLYSLVAGSMEVAAGMFSRAFGDRVGSRPLLLGVSVLGMLSMAGWAVVGEESVIPVFMVLGGITMFVNGAGNNLTARLLVSRMPESNPIVFNSMVNFVTAFFTFSFGMIGGQLLTVRAAINFSMLNTYGLTFLFAVLLHGARMIICASLKDQGSYSSRQTMALLFSLDSLRAYFAIGRLGKTQDPGDKKHTLITLGKNYTDLATREIRELIHGPVSMEKSEMLRTLYHYPRYSLAKDLIEEARDVDRFYRDQAVYTLGAYRTPEVREALIGLLNDSDSRVRSYAALSLGRHRAAEYLPEIASQFEQAQQPGDILNYITALHLLDEQGSYLAGLFSPRWDSRSPVFRQGLYSLVSRLCGMTPSLDALFALTNVQKGAGVRGFIEDTRDTMDFYASFSELVDWFTHERFDDLYRFCYRVLEHTDPALTGYWQFLKTSLVEYLLRPREGAVYSDAIAVFYFTYQCVHHVVHRT